MELEMPEQLKDSPITLILTGVLTGALLTVGATELVDTGPDAQVQEFISGLETSSGQELELVNLNEENGLYRAQISNQDDQLTTYYLTKNGELVIEESGVTNLQQFSQQVNARANFTGCMAERNVVMYGNSSQQETAAQIQLLGGTNMVSEIYTDVNERENLREAIERGIQRIPAFYYDNSSVEGIQSINNLENFTGCTYSESK